jgi:hypothetical protein
MQTIDVTLKIQYTKLKSQALERAWKDKPSLLLAMVKSDLFKLDMQFLEPTVNNVDWVSADNVVILHWIVDSSWVRSGLLMASSTG